MGSKTGLLPRKRGFVATLALLHNFFTLRNFFNSHKFLDKQNSALELLENFRSTGNHVSIVLNEYGALEGIVTLYDVVEAIFGDIPMKEQSRDEAVTVDYRKSSGR